MIRPFVLEVLGHVVHARISMERLQTEVLHEMRQGYQPLVFGHHWGRDHIDALTGASQALEVAWHLLKWIQAPGARSRLNDAAQSLSILAASRSAATHTAINATTATNGLTASQSQAPRLRDNRRVG